MFPPSCWHARAFFQTSAQKIVILSAQKLKSYKICIHLYIPSLYTYYLICITYIVSIVPIGAYRQARLLACPLHVSDVIIKTNKQCFSEIDELSHINCQDLSKILGFVRDRFL